MGGRLGAGFVALLGACGFTAGKGVGSDAGGDAPPIDSWMDSPIDSAIDAAIDGPSQPQCVSSGIMDTFQGNTPCSPWATSDSSGAQTTQNGGKLRIAGPTAATSATHGGCIQIGLAAWGPEGVFVNVDQTMAGGYTALAAYVASGTSSTIVVENGNIILRVPGGALAVSKVYEPTEMRWWRLRPVTGGIVGETSADALTWNMIGTIPGTPPAMIRIDLSAGTTGIVTGAGTAVFDNLNVCP